MRHQTRIGINVPPRSSYYIIAVVFSTQASSCWAGSQPLSLHATRLCPECAIGILRYSFGATKVNLHEVQTVKPGLLEGTFRFSLVK